MHHILMLSSSRASTEDYLHHAIPMIDAHLAKTSATATTIVFIPYAGVTIDYDEYTARVSAALPSKNIRGIHTFNSAREGLDAADVIMVGGGNTFQLLQQLYANELIEPIQQRVNNGLPYIGWSAGSNICGRTIRTTNDMPIVEPDSFAALGFIDCQLNPHYSDYQPPDHNGETRDQRLAEFCQLCPKTPVIAIREGTALTKYGDDVTLEGALDGFVFIGNKKLPITSGEQLKKWATEQN